MAASKKFTVGDKVMVTSVNARQGGAQERTVTRVGRLNVYTDSGYHGWHEKGFRIDSGVEVGNYTHEHVYTLQEWAERDERADLDKRLRAVMGDAYSYKYGRIANDKIRRIVDILEEPEDGA